MIDLRFVERVEVISENPNYDLTRTIRVLQWRKFLDPNTNYQRWSDWVDVPIVKEPTNEIPLSVVQENV
jgi:hypothetical protein